MSKLPLLVLPWIVLLSGIAFAEPPPVPIGSETASMEVEPRSVSAGDKFTATGDGCAPETSVLFTLYNPEAVSKGEIQSGSQGEFGADLQVPQRAQPGRAWLRAVCQTEAGRILVSEATLIVVEPSLVISWVNVLFGVGAAMVVVGFGTLMRRKLPRRSRRRVRVSSSS